VTDHAQLNVEEISKHFQGLQALADVSLSLSAGEIVGLVGPNGAGKSTLFDVITGLQKADSGLVRLDGKDISNDKPWDRCRQGLARTFQVVRPMPRLSVLENAMTGAFLRMSSPQLAARVAHEALQLVDLDDRAQDKAGKLTLAEHKRLEMARVIATKPRFLLLDEVFAGLRAGEQDNAAVLIRQIAAEGIGVLLIEHSMRLVTRLVSTIYVLSFGAIIASGEPEDVMRRNEVVEAYLGRRRA